MKTTEEKIAVMQAYAEGKTIQERYLNREWVDSQSPVWDWTMYSYRVKQESKLRKYNNAVELLEAIKEHGHYVKEGNAYRLLKKFTICGDGEIVYTLSGWKATTTRDWDAIHDGITWADGSPFGVEV